jgi:hypothetical protein
LSRSRKPQALTQEVHVRPKALLKSDVRVLVNGYRLPGGQWSFKKGVVTLKVPCGTVEAPVPIQVSYPS